MNWLLTNLGVAAVLGYKNRLPIFPISSGWFSFPTYHNYITFALIAKFTLKSLYHSTWSSSNFPLYSFLLLLPSHLPSLYPYRKVPVMPKQPKAIQIMIPVVQSKYIFIPVSFYMAWLIQMIKYCSPAKGSQLKIPEMKKQGTPPAPGSPPPGQSPEHSPKADSSDSNHHGSKSRSPSPVPKIQVQSPSPPSSPQHERRDMTGERDGLE